jgi:hypothetical protein
MAPQADIPGQNGLHVDVMDGHINPDSTGCGRIVDEETCSDGKIGELNTNYSEDVPDESHLEHARSYQLADSLTYWILSMWQ